MSLDQSHSSCFTLLIFIIWFYTGRLKNVLSCINARIRGCLQSARYKFCNLTSSKILKIAAYSYYYAYFIKNINNISLKFIMLTDNNQILRNWFVIIHCHLTKISAQIIQCIIFERNELYITLSTQCYYHQEINYMIKTILRFNMTKCTHSKLIIHYLLKFILFV